MPILEVIASSVRDAVEAERGGAGRLEIVRDLDRGGLTPSSSLVRAIREAVSLPLHVMLREREDDSLSADDAGLRAAAGEFQEIGANGLVIGFLRGGQPDCERMERILETAPELEVTFHHAFDAADDPLEAMDRLKRWGGADRILSSGGAGHIAGRAARLERYRERAGTEIAILAGGGLSGRSLAFLGEQTGIAEFHVGRAARFPRIHRGRVRAARVARLRQLLSAAVKRQSAEIASE